MKTELRLCQHLDLDGQHVIEVWHDGQFLATVAGSDGPGVRVISKHYMQMSRPDVGTGLPSVCQVTITPKVAEPPLRGQAGNYTQGSGA